MTTGYVIIQGNRPVLQRYQVLSNPGATAFTVNWHPEMAGVIESCIAHDSAQGFGIHGGDFRRRLTLSYLSAFDMTPVERDGKLNGDCFDLYGSHRLTMEWIRAARGYGGVKLAGNNHQVKGFSVEDMEAYGVVGWPGSLLVNGLVRRCKLGIEARQFHMFQVRTEDCGPGLLVTGDGASTAIKCQFDSVYIEAGCTLFVKDCIIGECDGPGELVE